MVSPKMAYTLNKEWGAECRVYSLNHSLSSRAPLLVTVLLIA